MSKIHLVIPDQHAHPSADNTRSDWLGKLITDLKPDVVINIGDAIDLPSLSDHEKGKASFVGASYQKDIESHLEFQERMWAPLKKAKKKRPYSVFCEGNHEYRIKRALNNNPELAGSKYGISFKDLGLDDYYHKVVEYQGSTPGIIDVDGILYAHYFISGLMGRPIGGEHHAHSLLAKNMQSSTCGHSHTVDWSVRASASGKKQMGCVAGVFQDYVSSWAGVVNRLWSSGVVIKRNVVDGMYDFEWVSIERLKKEYGNG